MGSPTIHNVDGRYDIDHLTNIPRCHTPEALASMGSYAEDDVRHETEGIKQPYPAKSDGINEKQGQGAETARHASIEIPFAFERFLSDEMVSPSPVADAYSTNDAATQRQVSPQLWDKASVQDTSVEPLCVHSNDTVHKHEDAVIDIFKLSQNADGCPPDPARGTELYTPRSAIARRRSSPSLGANQSELAKKVSFGSRASAPAMESSPSQEQPRPPLCNQPPPPKQQGKKRGPLLTTQSNKNISIGDEGVLHDGDEHKEENYSIFRTRSGKIERQLSRLQSKRQQEHQTDMHARRNRNMSEDGSVSAGRFFDALQGPELEILKDSEEVLLPLDKKWPFLLRFPIGCFGICLGLASQAILWKALATYPSMAFLHVPSSVNFTLWCLALMAFSLVFTTYAFKCLFYFEAVRREFHHPVRVNFFFAPWIACMLLAMGAPPTVTKSIHPSWWCAFTAPLLILELKIYGQWLSGGQRRLSKVANPSTHLSLVGNFVTALFGAQVGWKEPAMFFWAVGCAHYLVLFVTLYQRLPTAEVLPKELHPVFFLFIAAPSAASVAWESMVGDFDRVSRTAYFLALFLYASLVVRVKFFCGFQFSVAWWAYTFPMTASAIATVHYSMQIRHPLTQVLATALSVIATLTVTMVFVATILHVMWGSLFPNDIAIAITTMRHGRKKHKGRTGFFTNNIAATAKPLYVNGPGCFPRKDDMPSIQLQNGFLVK